MEDVCSTLGIRWKKNTTTSPRKAWKSVKEIVDNDVPVMLQANTFYLDYWRGQAGRFGHSIVLAGYDEERGEVYVTDIHRSIDRPELPEIRLLPRACCLKYERR